MKAFVDTRGLLALTNVLTQINRKSSPRSATGPMRDDKDIENELSIVKCVNALMNNRYGADDALAHPQIVISLISSLVSLNLITRKTVSDILTFLSHCGDGQGYQKVLKAMDIVKDQHQEAGRFDTWISVFEVAIDTHLHMHSSDSKLNHRRRIGQQNLLFEYCLSTTYLINMLVGTREGDLTVRCHIRAQFIACGIKRILSKLEGLNYGAINKEIERFRENEAIDCEALTQ